MSKEKLIKMGFISINVSMLVLVILATYLQNVQGKKSKYEYFLNINVQCWIF